MPLKPGSNCLETLTDPGRDRGILHSHVYLPAALLIDFRDVPIIAASDPKLKVFRENMIMFSGEARDYHVQEAG